MRCPVCRADNVEPVCRRCKADLGLLLAVEDERQRQMALATRAAAQGQGDRAQRHAAAAQELRRDDDAQRLLALGHLLNHDFSAALRVWRSLTRARS